MLEVKPTVWPLEVTEMAVTAPLQKHLSGGCTIDIPCSDSHQQDAYWVRSTSAKSKH